MKSLFQPFTKITKQTWFILMIVEAAIALILWQVSGGGLIPGPVTVLNALGTIVTNGDFPYHLMTSLFLTVKAMAISVVIALAISYTATIPVFKPISEFIMKCRYLTITGLVFLFTLLTQNGSELKLVLMIFGFVPFFITSFLSVLASIPQQEYDLCATLRMNKFETLFEVIIIGRADQVFDVMRQNMAIFWLMISTVETLSMSEGGLGVAIVKANKYIKLNEVFALLVVIFIVGICFDIVLGKMRTWLFPYTKLGVSK